MAAPRTLTAMERDTLQARKQRSPQFRDGRFANTHGVHGAIQGSMLGFLRERMVAPKLVPRQLPPTCNPLALWQPRPATPLRATWLGHSTVLLEIGGYRVLTDPVWGRRASPFSWLGPLRFLPVPVAMAALPPLDAIIISHDHYDHLCRASVVELARRGTPLVTSLGVGAHLRRWGIAASQIIELDWQEQHVLGGLTIAAEAAQHFSGRTMAASNQTLWSSWVIKTPEARVFFSGDSGVTSEFQTIGERYQGFDLALLEIGAAHRMWPDIHMGPQGAMRAMAMLQCFHILPVHWGTFALACHPWDEPITTLLDLAGGTQVTVHHPRMGLPIEPLGPGLSPDYWFRGELNSSPGPAQRK